MSLSAGTRLGAYEVLVPIGKGGMGEVWKARDTRLGREVAIKISAEQFTERFEQEAHAISSLNHPNICTLHDVGPDYLVMELIDGETLAERIKQGAIPVEEALTIARQIADALEAAHEKGITHRDLKPGNIKIRPDGMVKVLDFGLAKMGGTPSVQSEDSPTMTMAATQAGVILGTAAYMAPEQARGKPVDKRADIWAFGVVLYEIVTGDRPFQGEDLTDTLASVVKIDPDLSRIPRRLRRLITACLQKDPQKRLQAIGDMKLLLEEDEAPATLPPPTPKTGWLWPVIAAVCALAAGVSLRAWLRTAPPELQSVQFQISAPGEDRFFNNYGSLSVSPDGRYVIFAAQGKDGESLWLRSLDSKIARPLSGTGMTNFPFWSPDSKSVGFTSRSDLKLKRIEIAGGAPLVLADVAGNPNVTQTGTWNRDGVILFGGSAGLQRVSATGGGASPLTIVDPKQKETGHGYPQFLPDEKSFLYFVASDEPNVQGVYASSLDAPQQRTLIVRTDAKAVYVPSKGSFPAYLLWLQEDTLVAQRFNADRLEREGEPVSVAQNLQRNANAPVRAGFWASDAGLLVYWQGEATFRKNRLVWMSRDGKLLGDAVPEGPLNSEPRISPDGTRVAFTTRDADSAERYISVWEFRRSLGTRLTFDKERVSVPVWSPDSKQVAYVVSEKGLFLKDASGAGQAERLLPEAFAVPLDWSHDGKFISYRNPSGLMALPVPGSGAANEGKPFPLLERGNATFSPNGKWIAFSSLQGIFIQPFVAPGSGANPGGRWQVTKQGGGTNPVWRGDGKEIYYATPEGNIMAASVQEDGQALKIGVPVLLLKAGSDSANLHSFDATQDGQKFLIQQPPAVANQADDGLTVVTNWQAALRQ